MTERKAAATHVQEAGKGKCLVFYHLIHFNNSVIINRDNVVIMLLWMFTVVT